jgi:hypothetical protein
VDTQEYVELHHELINLCQGHATTANDVEAAIYRYLEDLLQPSLDLHILARAERDILFDLLIRC